MGFSKQEYWNGLPLPSSGDLPNPGIEPASPALIGRFFTTEALTCLLGNLYAGQEATVRIGHGTADWFQIGKGVLQGCILSPRLFNLYAEYIMKNAYLDDAQAGIKIAGRNINNLRYAGDITLMAESE